MLNQFDFYTVKVHASTKTALKKAGVNPANIERRKDGVACYGQRCFIRWVYVATVGFFNVDASAKADECAAEWSAKGVRASVGYHCAD